MNHKPNEAHAEDLSCSNAERARISSGPPSIVMTAPASRPPLRITLPSPLLNRDPIQIVDPAAYYAEVDHIGLVALLILAGRSGECTFERSYRAVYNMVLWRQGSVAYDIMRTHIARASLRLRRDEFGQAVHKLQAVAHYMCTTYCMVNELPDIETMAVVLYDRPAARGWRAIARIARWAGLIVRCRRAFDEVRLRPGASGALACADHFKFMVAMECVG